MQRRREVDERQLSAVAWMYYVADMTQGEIAQKLGVSRPTVLSYLKQAKEMRLLEIRLRPDHFRLNDLSARLCARFALSDAFVVENAEDDPRRTLEAVTKAAAYIVSDHIEQGDVLGVSWGETIWLMAQSMPLWGVDDVTVRQLIGSMANPVIQSAEMCTTEIARRLKARCVNLNAPAVCTRADLAAGLREEPIIAAQLADLSTCNKAVFSLSPCDLSTHVFKLGVCTEDSIAEYAARGAVGIIAGRFIDKDGEPVHGSVDERLIGVTMPTLREIGNGMLVVSGAPKVAPTLAAMRGGYVTRLVADTTFAEALLAM